MKLTLLVLAASMIHALQLGSSLSSSFSIGRSIGSSIKATRKQFISGSAGAISGSAGAMMGFHATSASATESTSSPEENGRYRQQEVSMVFSDAQNLPRTRGVLVKRYTGESTPYKFKKSPIRLVKKWPDEPPFTRQDMSRADEHKDNEFYVVPRFVYHIDEGAVSALTNYYKSAIAPGSSILDIASSWVSHYPLDFPDTMKKISGSGMNRLEMVANDQLSDFTVKDLNERDSNNADLPPTLPYGDGVFDAVTCVVSIDYMIHPIEVLREVNRVLKPGGKVILSQSNRCFPSKAVNMWLNMNDREHLELINGYLKYAGGYMEGVEAWDISASGGDAYDPMYIVEARKKGE